MKVDVLVVGAGFAGSVVAERCASAGRSVLVIDKRDHIAGNAYDEHDRDGLLVHRYGPHIFHTNSSLVSEYLSRFTEWIPYEHRVLASLNGELYPIPINQTTVNRLYGLSLDEEGVSKFLEGVRENRDPVRTSEDVVLSSVGRDLCDKFFRGYTRKQWGIDLSDLSASVAARIPVRTGTDDRYFTDSFQKMPADGYTKMFARMLDHRGITVDLGQDFRELRQHISWNLLFFTGPIDEYYDYRFGKLQYRSLRFEHEHIAGVKYWQPVGTVNYPNDYDFTRITEFKHMTGQQCEGTSIVREFPEDEGEPYYPVPRPANQTHYEQYRALLAGESDVFMIGRLAQYRYYNMDQVVAAALKLADSVLGVRTPGVVPTSAGQPQL